MDFLLRNVWLLLVVCILNITALTTYALCQQGSRGRAVPYFRTRSSTPQRPLHMNRSSDMLDSIPDLVVFVFSQNSLSQP
jgi:hypothetical protein